MRSKVHPKYKTKYRVGNWSAYEQALVQRGDVTLWLSADATDAWRPAPSGRPGVPKKFSDCTIETALTLRLVFRLPLRQAEGFLRSVLSLMGVDLAAPDHTTLSRRSQSLAVEFRRIPSRGPIHRIVDSTGLSIVGEGEWAAVKHGGRGHRGWKKVEPRHAQGGFHPDGLELRVDADTAIAPALGDRERGVPARWAAGGRWDVRSAIVLKPSTILDFHRILRNRKYRLEDLAEKCGRLASSYPNYSIDTARVLSPNRGTVIVFVDGLRWDLAPELLDRLTGTQLEGIVGPNWAPLPTVTATAKPAWMPFAEHACGAEVSAVFEPQLRDSNRPVRAAEFRGVLDVLGWQHLPPSSLGKPTGIAWTEAGSIDRYGHDDSSMFPRRIDQKLQAVCTRVRDLVSAGWKKVVITTDHGWLFMPGGLPKVDLPKHLTVSKWGRCAVPQAGATHPFPQVPWFWAGEHVIVLAPGVSVFRGGTEYAHGGLTLQECLIPTLTLRASGTTDKASVRIESAKWIGLRLQIQLSESGTAVQIDLRTRPAAAESSILSQRQRLKSPGASGRVSLTVEDDDRLGQAVVLVVLLGEQVVAKQAVTVGEN